MQRSRQYSALFEIALLLMGIIAFSTLIAFETPIVEAQTGNPIEDAAAINAPLRPDTLYKIGDNLFQRTDSSGQLSGPTKIGILGGSPGGAFETLPSDYSISNTNSLASSSAINPASSISSSPLPSKGFGDLRVIDSERGLNAIEPVKISSVIGTKNAITSGRAFNVEGSTFSPSNTNPISIEKINADEYLISQRGVTDKIVTTDQLNSAGISPDQLTTKGTLGSASSSGGALGTLKQVFQIQSGGFVDILGSSLAWGSAVGLASFGALKLLGADEKYTNSIPFALGLGTTAGIFIGRGLEQGLFGGEATGFASGIGNLLGGGAGTGAAALGIVGGLGVAALIFYLTYKDEEVRIVSFSCYPWEAPSGGSKCEECNKQGILPCSEYQCRALGQSCQLLNSGTEGKELCTWVNRNDVSPPVIQPRDSSLSTDLTYTPDNTISPPDRGVFIKYQKANDPRACIPAFKPFTFGITLNEPGKCKLDYVKKDTFDDMEFFFGGQAQYSYNHTQTLSLPGPSAAANNSLVVRNNGSFELFVRCMDANGNTNPANFVFKYCVGASKDTTPPIIIGTNILNDAPIAFNQTTADIELYLNEPATCKWSQSIQEYDRMENELRCSSDASEMNAQMLYTCATKLTGLKDRTINKYYFLCKDQPLAEPSDRNENSEAYELRLVGTKPLIISKVGPNETVRDASEVIKVTLTAETNEGHNDGESVCYFGRNGTSATQLIKFLNTGSNTHSQDLFLTAGRYNYTIRCVDLGGNVDTKQSVFSVEADGGAPQVVRVYHEDTFLKLVTSETASCVYDTKDCTYQFKDGTATTVKEKIYHYAPWDLKNTYYIKCKDRFENEPLPNVCSIVVRPYTLSSA